MGTRIRIGDFARLAQVTIRTLRHYEDEGLLNPAHVDRRTRYRYYDVSQLLTLQRLLVLRDLGVSIPEIRDVLRCEDGGAGLLRKHRLRLREAIRVETARLNQLEAILIRLESDQPVAVRVRPVPSVDALCQRTVVPALGAPVTEMFESAEAAAKRARIDASPFLLFHGYSKARGIDLEVCIPVWSCARLPGVRSVEGTASACCVIYQGAYSQTPSMYASMLRWVDRIGASTVGPLREVYHRFGADQRRYRLPAHRLSDNAASYVTELQIPIARSPS